MFPAEILAREAFVVLKLRNSPPPTIESGMWHMGNSGATHYPFSDGNIYDEFGTHARKMFPYGAHDFSQWHVYNVAADNPTWEARLNGELKHAVTDNTYAGVGDPFIGASSGHIFNGQMAEVIFYDHILTPDERQYVMSYLQAKYGLAP
jgi:hypothetical protein